MPGTALEVSIFGRILRHRFLTSRAWDPLNLFWFMHSPPSYSLIRLRLLCVREFYIFGFESLDRLASFGPLRLLAVDQ